MPFFHPLIHPYRVVLPNVRLVEDALVPQDPADVVERQRHEQVLVHLDATAVQTPVHAQERKEISV